jgi:hypothetical protein
VQRAATPTATKPKRSMSREKRSVSPGKSHNLHQRSKEGQHVSEKIVFPAKQSQ